MTLFVMWNAVLLVLLRVFVLALAGFAGPWGLDPVCNGKFARSRLLRR